MKNYIVRNLEDKDGQTVLAQKVMAENAATARLVACAVLENVYWTNETEVTIHSERK